MKRNNKLDTSTVIPAVPVVKPLSRIIAYVLAIGGIIGFLAAFILTVEKIELIKDPSFQPSCNISPLISCGSVMVTGQAEAFGFANSLIGVAGFAAVATIGVALLAGAMFKRWFWIGLQIGTIFGIAFVTWLFFQSVYRIGALCPYCMVVWSAMIPIFIYTTLYNLQQRHISVPARLEKASNFLQRHHGDIVLAWFLILIGLILHNFWYYWSTLI